MIINGQELTKSLIFSGGEVHIELPEITDLPNNPRVLFIETTLDSSDKIMELLMVNDALDFYFPKYRKILRCLYYPYARQDRRYADGAFSKDVFNKLIDSLGFDKIIAADMHSDLAMPDTQIVNIPAIDIIAGHYPTLINSRTVLVAPDKGAAHRVSKVAEYYDCKTVQASKVRVEGSIQHTEITSGSEYIHNSDLVIIDDICDGGNTFILLAEELRKYSPKSITLYVTHGIFSKGLDVLSNIDRIVTTDSICKLVDNKLTVLHI